MLPTKKEFEFFYHYALQMVLVMLIYCYAVWIPLITPFGVLYFLLKYTIHKQTVTDFLRFYTDNPEWVAWLRGYGIPPEYPSFNVADISLVVGVILFVGHSFFEQDEPEDTPAEANGAEA